MRVTDVIRGVLDIIDHAEQPAAPVVAVSVIPSEQPDIDTAELVRMRQIAGLVGSGETEYSNSPEEMISGIDAVLASGDDVHHSKHPADIRTDAPSMYPFHQHKPGA